MKTTLTESPEEAAAFVRGGDVVAFPTETVYGLGADALSPDAVRKIFEAKGRPSDNPLIIHVSRRDQIDSLVRSVADSAQILIDRFFPGPLTVIAEKSDAVPPIVTAGLQTVGIRMPAHPTASAFLEACKRPVAAPSANRSGRPSPTTWEAVLADLSGTIPCILKGDRAKVGLESTVVDCTGTSPVILRAGAVTLEQLQEAIPDIRLVNDAQGTVRSPGMKHRHYAPRARVEVVSEPPADPDDGATYIGLETPASEFRLTLVVDNVEAYAHELFDYFRRSDEAGASTIYCQRVDERGLGLALMDRLRRASESSSG